MALKVLKVEQVPRGTLVLLVKPERRGNLVFQDCPGIQEDKVQRVPPDFPASQGPTERKVHGASRASRALAGSAVPRVLEGPEERAAPPGSQARRALRAAMAPQALLEREARKDLRVRLDSRDLKALLDHLGRTACQGTLGNVERLDFKARPALLGPGALLDHRGPLGRPVPWANAGILALRGRPVSKAFLARREKKAQRATQVLKVSRGKTARQVSVVSQANEVSLELRVHLA